MSIWNTFGVDPDLEENGVWITDIAGDEEFLLASYNNKKHLQSIADYYKKNEAKIKNGAIDEDSASRYLIKAFCKHVLLGWKNVKDINGNDLEYTPENAYKLLSDPILKHLLRELETLSKEKDAYKLQAREEHSKN